MQVEKVNAGATAERDGVRSWFCSDGCRDAFLALPTGELATHGREKGRHDHH
jgi:YHS domain-containing protein